MIVISLVLVVISAVSLLVGAAFREDLLLIYVSIGAALLAALFLILGVLKGRRRPKTVTAVTLPGDDPAGRPATWQGAGWGGPQAEDAGLSRDDASGDGGTPVIRTTEQVDETVRIDEGRADEGRVDQTVRIDESAYAPPPPAPRPPEPAPSSTGGPSPAPAPAPPDDASPAPTAPTRAWAPPPPPPSPSAGPPTAPPGRVRGIPPPPPPG